MTKIYPMLFGHIFWEDTIRLAENCSWNAGKYLAKIMKDNSFLPWERVFAACIGEMVVGFCTLTEKDELPDKYPYTPLIGFVFVNEEYRGDRISQVLIDSACSYACEIGYKDVYIMSSEMGLYEKYGFKKLCDCETIYGGVEQLLVRNVMC